MSFLQRLIWITFPVLIAGFVSISLPVSWVMAQQVDESISVYPIDSEPFGIPYAEWTGKWWKWALEAPAARNPVSDVTGENCAEGQEGPVWFLAGTFGGSAVRSCTIPADKAVLWNPISQECSYAEFPALKTESDLRSCVRNFQDKVTDAEVTIDGMKLQNLSSYRIQSPLFNFTLPQDNVLALPEQTTTGVSDGIWVFLQPLPPGNHQIQSKGVSVDFTGPAVQNFVADVRYDLTVE